MVPQLASVLCPLSPGLWPPVSGFWLLASVLRPLTSGLWPLALASGLLLPLSLSAENVVRAAAPIEHFSLPTFTKEGWRDLLFRANEAKVITPRHFEVQDLTLTVFAKNADNTIDSVLVSPKAIVLLDAGTVGGPSTVRLVRDDLEVSGADWQYTHADKKILIQRDAHIILRATFTDLLQ